MELIESLDIFDYELITEFPEFFRKIDNDAPTEIGELASAIQFNMNFTCDDEKFKDACASIMNDIRNSIGDNRHTANSLKSIIANLIYATQIHPRQTVYYSRRSESYVKSPATNIFNLRRNETAGVIDALVAHDYIENTPGFNFDNPGAQSVARQPRIQAKSKLIDSLAATKHCKVYPSTNCDFVLLRDGEKELKAHGKSQTFLGMNNRVKIINEVINSAEITLPLDFINKHSRGEKRLVIDGNYVDLRKTYLYRIFNNNFKSGGRFYRGYWQQLSEDQRSLIHINGQETIEKDFCAIHPNLLYVFKTKKLFDGDPYDIPEHSGDKVLRKATKLAFLILLNAKDKKSAQSALYQRFYEHDNSKDESQSIFKRTNITDLLDAIDRIHAPIKNYFASDISGKLQFTDARIAEETMLTLAKSGIVCLPVHDSFIVQKQFENDLISAMDEAFKKVTGSKVSPMID
jgi:hypothetical protein